MTHLKSTIPNTIDLEKNKSTTGYYCLMCFFIANGFVENANANSLIVSKEIFMKFKFVERVIYLFMCAVIALMGFVLTADAQQFLVRTIYFQPANAPGVKGNLSGLLERTQDFFRSEMERYGYGQKTFRYERDGNGDIQIHVIKGKHRLNHYLQDTYRRIAQELPFKFTLDPKAKDNVHVIVLGGTRQLDNGSAGYAWYHVGKAGCSAYAYLGHNFAKLR